MRKLFCLLALVPFVSTVLASNFSYQEVDVSSDYERSGLAVSTTRYVDKTSGVNTASGNGWKFNLTVPKGKVAACTFGLEGESGSHLGVRVNGSTKVLVYRSESETIVIEEDAVVAVSLNFSVSTDGGKYKRDNTFFVKISYGDSYRDLYVSSFSVSPESGLTSDPITLSFKISNKGTTEAGASTAYVYDGTAKIGTVSVSKVAAGGSCEGSYTISAYTLTAGSHSFSVKADGGGSVAESDESNNSSSQRIVEIKEADAKDLYISSFSVYPESATPSDSVKLSFTISNKGTLEAEASTLYVYDGDIKIGSASIASVKAGESRSGTYTIAENKLGVGTHSLWVKADGGEIVAESDETNNSSPRKSVTIQGAAQEEGNEVEVTFHLNAGLVDKCTTRTYSVDSTYGDFPIMARDNYDFIGWFTKSSGGVQVKTTDKVDGDITNLYAHWQEEAVDSDPVDPTPTDPDPVDPDPVDPDPVDPDPGDEGGGTATGTQTVTFGADGGTKTISFTAQKKGDYTSDGSSRPSWVTGIRVQTPMLSFGAGRNEFNLNAGDSVTVSLTVAANDGAARSWTYLLSGPSGSGVSNVEIKQDGVSTPVDPDPVDPDPVDPTPTDPDPVDPDPVDPDPVLEDGGPYVETVDGVEWTFMVKYGKVSIGSKVGIEYGRAISEQQSGAVTIPSVLGGSPVTSVGSDAFKSCVLLTSITIPQSVTYVSGTSFRGCDSLESFVVDPANETFYARDGVLYEHGVSGDELLVFCPRGKSSVLISGETTVIDSYSFEDCNLLRSVSIPSSVKVLGFGVFSGCKVLESVTFSPGVTQICDYAFLDCPALSTICFPSTLQKIGIGALGTCPALMTVDFEGLPPKGLSEIHISSNAVVRYSVNFASQWEAALASCPFTGYPYDQQINPVDPDPVLEDGGPYTNVVDGLSWRFFIEDGEATVGGGGTSQNGNAVVGDCLGDVAIPEALGGCPVCQIGAFAFWDCEGLTSVSIPSSVREIEYGAFQYCRGLTAIQIPSGVESVGIFAFSDCTGLESVTIPSSLMSIDMFAFSDCNRLTSVWIPAGVKYIAEGVFATCVNLTSIQVDSENEGYCSVDGVLFSKDKDRLVCFPAGRKGDYALPEEVTYIGGNAFWGCEELTSVTLTPKVTDIDLYAFAFCKSMRTIAIPSTVSHVSQSSFCNSGLVSASLSSGVKSIGKNVFEGCYFLKSIVIPSSVDEIQTNAFAWTDLSTVYVDAGDASRICNLLAASGCDCSGMMFQEPPWSYEVTYMPGVYGAGPQQTVTGSIGSDFRLSGAIFNRDGYVQSGWSEDETGGTLAYELDESYLAGAAVTLYPYWSPADPTPDPVDPDPVDPDPVDPDPVDPDPVDPDPVDPDPVDPDPVDPDPVDPDPVDPDPVDPDPVDPDPSVRTTTVISFGTYSKQAYGDTVVATNGLPMPYAGEPPSQCSYHFLGYFDTEDHVDGKMYYDSSMQSVRNWDKTETSVMLYAHWAHDKHSFRFTGGDGCEGEEYVLETTRQNVRSWGTYWTFSLPSCTFARKNCTFRGWFSPQMMYNGLLAVGDEAYRTFKVGVTNQQEVTFGAVWSSTDLPDILYSIIDGAASIVRYDGKDKVLAIPEKIEGFPVVDLANDSFNNVKNLSSVTIPNTVTNIGWSVFYSCPNLGSVKLPDALMSVGGYSLCILPKLRDIVIPDNVQTLDDSSLLWNENLTNLVFGSSVERFNYQVLDNRSSPSLQTVVFRGAPPTVKGVVAQESTIIGYYESHGEEWQQVITNGYWNNIYMCRRTCYTVAFSSNEGDESVLRRDSTVRHFDETFNLAPNEFVRSGYVFAGWSLAPTGTVAFADGEAVSHLTDKSDGETVLYAVWKAEESVSGVSFASAEVLSCEGGVLNLSVIGGSANAASSVDIYLTALSATVKDLSLTGVMLDGRALVDKLTFPITIRWNAGEIGAKRLTIPVSADKAVEGDETLIVQLANPQGQELGETTVCLATIHDAGYDALKTRIDAGAASSSEKSSWKKLQEQASIAYVAGLADSPAGGKVTGTKGVKLDRNGVYKTVTLKATPAKGHWFAGWYDAQGELAETDFSLKATPTADDAGLLAYSARFVEADASLVGTYGGMASVNLRGMTVVKNAWTTSDVVGLYPVTLTLSSSGKISGSVAIGGKKAAFKGETCVLSGGGLAIFQATMDEKAWFGRANGESLLVGLTSEGNAMIMAESLEGDYAPLSGEEATAVLYRAVGKDASSLDTARMFVGTYSVVLPDEENGLTALSVTVDAKGKAKVSGRFRDGTSLACSTALCGCGSQVFTNGVVTSYARLVFAVTPKSLGAGSCAVALALSMNENDGSDGTLGYSAALAVTSYTRERLDSFTTLDGKIVPYEPGCWLPEEFALQYPALLVVSGTEAVTVPITMKDGVATGLGKPTTGYTVKFDNKTGLFEFKKAKEYTVHGIFTADGLSVGRIEADGTLSSAQVK